MNDMNAEITKRLLEILRDSDDTVREIDVILVSALIKRMQMRLDELKRKQRRQLSWD